MKQLFTLTALATMLVAAYPAVAQERGENASPRMTGTKPTTVKLSGSAGWESESHYWRKNYSHRPYYNKSKDFSTYEPAYKYGVEVYNRNPGARYEDLKQSYLNSGWNKTRGNSNLNWKEAQKATRDSYERLYQIHYNMTRNNSNDNAHDAMQTTSREGNDSPSREKQRGESPENMDTDSSPNSNSGSI